MEKIRFNVFLSMQLKGIGNVGRLKLLNWWVDSPTLAVTTKELGIIAGVKQNHFSIFSESYQQVLENRDILEEDFLKTGFITILDNEYPDYLREMYNPPVALFYYGNISFLKRPSIGIVGSRNFTPYGEQAVSKLVPGLVEKKLVIVSGLAKGIDTAAHQLAIRCKGDTIGVIGSGLDRVYPKENFRLQEHMAKHQLVISEYPHGMAPFPYHFPARNRIIAGVSRGICVVEAKRKSGSLITAQLALESGRDVFAVPGPITSVTSEGCHDLIQQGAKCVYSAKDILDELPSY